MRQLDWKSLGLLVLLGLLWGSGYALARYATTHGVPPLGYACWQSIGPAVLLSFYVYFTAHRITSTPADWLWVAVIGLVGIAIPNSNMYFIAPHLPAGVLAVIVNTAPLFTYFLALLFKDESFQASRLGCVLLALAGVMLIILANQHLAMIRPGPLLQALVSPFCFALVAVLISKRSCSWSPLVMAAGMMVASSGWLLPVTLYAHQFYWPHPSWQTRDTVVVLETVISSCGYVVFFALLQRAGAVYYSFVGGVVAMMGLFWGSILFNERFSLITWLGMLTVVIATVLVTAIGSSRVRR